MANNYTQSSSQLEIPKDKHAQAQAIIDKFMQQFEDDDGYCGIEVELEPDGVWIYGEESFDVDQAAELAQMLVDELEIEEPFVFSWAYSCSKMRLDEFGDGACLVRKGLPCEVIDASNYIKSLIKRRYWVTSVTVRHGEHVTTRKAVVEAKSEHHAKMCALEDEVQRTEPCELSDLETAGGGWYSNTWEYHYSDLEATEVSEEEGRILIKHLNINS